MSATVAGAVVVHGPDADLASCLAALAEQTDELVVVSNLAGTPVPLPPGARLVENHKPVGFAANANRGITATTAPWVLIANPDAVARPGVVATLLRHGESHPRAGVVGPQLVYPDGGWQPSRRRFPTVWGTVVRRTPIRAILPPERFSRAHYLLDERPTEPVEADWMLGGFLLLRRAMLDELGGFDAGYRLYGEDIDLCYRAARAGWERWYVPDAVVQHRLGEMTAKRFFTRRTLWHYRGILRFVRKHPERLRALR
jgi:N-acetylglucosaminyl-diphospho-decaprenol L-rhamnosyltransferase